MAELEKLGHRYRVALRFVFRKFCASFVVPLLSIFNQPVSLEIPVLNDYTAPIPGRMQTTV